MPETVESLAADLNEARTRFRFPLRPIFMCGGVIREDDRGPSPSLRDYLIRVRGIARRLPDKVVLAESANQLFLRTDYKSLIQFEEDIALLSGLVVLIAESPGSLAELGSFEANKTIRRRLRVLTQEAYEADTSFVRNGPLRQLISDNEDSVAFYPWRVNSHGMLVRASVSSDVQSIVGYIRDEYLKSPQSLPLKTTNQRRKSLFFLYWIVHLSGGQKPSVIYEVFRSVFPGAKDADIRNGLFCLELLGWIGRVAYGPREYFFALHDEDPFNYRFKLGVRKKNATARKQEAFEWVERTYPVERRAKRRILERRRELVE